MDSAKIASYVGFAIKARKAGFGVDNIVVKKSAPYLVLIDRGLSENSYSKLLAYTSKHSATKTYRINISEIYKSENCKVIAIYDGSLANAVITELEKGVLSNE